MIGGGGNGGGLGGGVIHSAHNPTKKCLVKNCPPACVLGRFAASMFA